MQSDSYDEDCVKEALIPFRSEQSLEADATSRYGNYRRHDSTWSKRRKRQSPDERQRQDDEVIFWRTMGQIAGIASPALHIVQLRQSFIYTYLASDVIQTNRPFYNTFYWMAPQNKALQASRDGLCLVHLGLKFRDPRLLMEGRKKHIAGINFLRREVERMKTEAVVDDGTIAAAFTLGNTELYSVASEVTTGWQHHMDGIYHLFRKRGPDIGDSSFAQALLHNSRHPAVMDGILRRKPCLFSEPAWMAAANKNPTIGTKLTNFAVRIPVLLQQVDRICGAASPDEVEVMPMLAKLVTMENDIQEWLMRFYELTSGDKNPYRTRSIDEFSQFKDLCGGLAHIFPVAIEFPSFVSATSHNYVWICLLVLRKAIMAVTDLYPYPLVRPRHQKTALVASVNDCAVNLCQSIAYLSRPEHVSCGILACSGPLYFAAEWFKDQNAVQRLAWTRYVRDFLERDSSLGGGADTPHKLEPPMFIYWMLPNIFDHEQR